MHVCVRVGYFDGVEDEEFVCLLAGTSEVSACQMLVVYIFKIGVE